MAVSTAQAARPLSAPGLCAQLPLLEMQRIYFIGDSAEPERQAGIHFEIRIPDYQGDRFQAAWERLVQRHGVLRAAISADGFQHLLDRRPSPPVTVDLRTTHEEALLEALSQLRARVRSQRFAPASARLLLVTVALLPRGAAHLFFDVSLLLVDGQGLSILLGELAELYADPALYLPEPESGYGAAVLASLKTDVGRRAAAEAYWNARLPELPGAPELPRLHGARVAGPLVRRSLRLSQLQWKALKSEAGARGITASMALCAAYAEVLGLWSGSSRFLLGLMVSARRDRSLARVVGNFSSLALLAVEPCTGLSFEMRAKLLQAQFFRDVEHHQVSGLELLERLNRAQSNALESAAPVVFSSNLHLRHQTPLARSAGAFSIYGDAWGESALETPQVWLDLSVSEHPDGGLVAHWDGRDTLFPPGLMEEMAAAYVTLLGRLTGPAAWESLAPVEPPADQLRLRAEVNATEQPLVPAPLHEEFFAQAVSRGTALALVGPDYAISHARLAAEAERIAAELQRLGAGCDRLVAVVLEKGWRQIAAALGVIRAGAAYLPVDPGLPAERRKLLMESGEVTLVVTDPALDLHLEWPTGVHRLTVPVAADATARPPAAGPESLAYVLFTSGSTGVPKGVAIEHHAAWNTIVDINRRWRVSAADRVFAISPLNFDLSVWDLFGLLGAGGALVLPAVERLADPAHWIEQMHAHAVSVWNSAPAVMQMLVEHLEAAGRSLPVSLRLVLLSGDWIPTTLPERIRALAAPGLEVVSLGGATEAAIWSIAYPIGEVPADWASIPYGKPLANQTMHVLDGDLRPRPTWVPGDLYIGGTGLAREYWRDPQKTAASFITHPRSSERLYRTGDLGRWLPDGNIEFLGRRDGQIKLRGFRIELGEIETLLGRHPVVSAAAAGVQGSGAARRLVAWCVPASAASPDLSADLRDYLAARLPAYMVPQSIHLLSSLPMTSNGKLDRRALASLGQEEAPRLRRAPAGPTERRVAALWAEVLGVRQVGAEENFFELGGESFAAVRLMARIQRDFGLQLPLSALLSEPTVAGLARRMDAAGSGEGRLIRLCAGAGGVPVFFVHAAGGNVLCYRKLAEALADSVPLFAFEARGLASGELPHQSIEAMATEYATAVAARVGNGPVVLGGWSSGGVVAFEMARVLFARGIKISGLLLIDSPAPLEREPVSEEAAIGWFLTDLEGRRVAAPPGRSPAERLNAGIKQRLRAAGESDGTAGEATLQRAYAVFRAAIDALRSYAPAPLAVPATIVKAGGEPLDEFLTHPALQHADWGWEGLLTIPPECIRLPGDHYGLLTGSNAQRIAGEIETLAAGGKTGS